MATNLWLTDEASEIAGYRLARVGRRSECCSLVRAVTGTEAGPSSGVQVTRTAGGTALAWITEPLAGITLTAAAWVVHVWAKESAATANAALRAQVYRYTTAEAGSALLDSNAGTELGTTIADAAITTGNATPTTLSGGDRLVIKLLIDDAGTMGASQTVTVAYNGERGRAEGDSYLTCPDDLAVLGGLPEATVTRVRRLLHQEHGIGQAAPTVERDDIAQAFAAALARYSIDRPRLLAAALSGDGSAHDFGLPPEWAWGLSALISLEYPAGEQVPALVDHSYLMLYETALGGQPVRSLRFRRDTPALGADNILVRYTARHHHTDERDTVPADDLEALCWLAASNVAEAKAAEKADSSDPAINADVTNHRDGESRWAAVARRLRARYRDHVGMGRPVVAPPSWERPRAINGWRSRRWMP